MVGDSPEALLAFAEDARERITGPDGKALLAQLDAQYAELLAAIEMFVVAQRTDEALRLANAVYPVWIMKQRFADGASTFERVLARPDGDERLRGAAFVNAGMMAFWLGDDERAADLFGRGLEIGRRLGDAPMTSRALGGLSRVALRSDVAEGRRLAGEALTVSEAAGDAAGISNALHLLGVGAQIAGDLVEARAWMTRRLAVVREAANEAMISSEAANLSMVERQLGNLDAAYALVHESLEIAERRGDDFMKPFALSGLAAIAAERGQHEWAATLIGAAEAMMDAQGAAWPPDEKPHYERLLAHLPPAMGRRAFEQARSRGRTMRSADAVALALAGPAGP